MHDYKKILEGIVQLSNNYASTYRGNIEFHKYDTISKLTGNKSLKFSNEAIRETLLCHVGHLPVVASYLYQFLENREDISLGDALVMLAIHDIGETVVGDVVTIAMDRTIDEEKEELIAVKLLLSKDQFKTYLEYENPTTHSGRFAKSIDKLSGVIMSYCTPATLEKSRMEYFGFSVNDIYERYTEYMQRDSFLKEFFEVLISELKKNIGNVKK